MVLAFAGDSTITTSIDCLLRDVNTLGIDIGKAFRQPKAHEKISRLEKYIFDYGLAKLAMCIKNYLKTYI